jgi:protein tyrosine phosphatase
MLVSKQGFDGNRNYIATQGPKLSTLNDFWRMCFEQDVRVIVALTLMEEKGRVSEFQNFVSNSIYI